MPGRPIILQIIPHLDTGGAELATMEIAQAVVAAGGRAIVLSEGGRLSDSITRAGGEVVPFPAATKLPWLLWRNAGRIAQIIRDENVDLVHARSRAPAWSALWAARRTGKPFVTTYHGAYNESGPAKRLYNSVMARGDVVIANSHYTAGLIRARYATPEQRIAVIYRGIDEQRFDAALVERTRVNALRSAWGVSEGQRVILHAARLTRWKGQSTVIGALADLARCGRLGDAVAVFAGDAQGRDDYVAMLKAEAARAGLTDRVRFPGHVADMPAAFATAYIAVVASIEPEAFGRAGAEAQAMGCPVISTDIGAPPETVLAPPRVAAGAATGWLVPPGDVSALSSALGEALDMSIDQRSAMGNRASSHVRTRFALSTMQAQTLAVYDRLLSTGLSTGGVGRP